MSFDGQRPVLHQRTPSQQARVTYSRTFNMDIVLLCKYSSMMVLGNTISNHLGGNAWKIREKIEDNFRVPSHNNSPAPSMSHTIFHPYVAYDLWNISTLNVLDYPLLCDYQRCGRSIPGNGMPRVIIPPA